MQYLPPRLVPAAVVPHLTHCGGDCCPEQSAGPAGQCWQPDEREEGREREREWESLYLCTCIYMCMYIYGNTCIYMYMYYKCV